MGVKLVSSSGGSVEIVAPVTASTYTQTLPANNGTILTTATAGIPISGPAFSAYASAGTSMSNNTYTKIQFQTELYDTNSNFDSTTNYRFQPTIAGYYVVCGGFAIGSANVSTDVVIYKNGSGFVRLAFTSGTGFGSGSYGSAQLYLNGSSDYIEIYGKQLSGGTVTSSTGTLDTAFSAAMVRSAT
jgi:hypothetical protein